MASTLRILPEIETKSLVCEGIIAVRESVALTVVMPTGAMNNGDDIHVRIRGKYGDVAKFPLEENDSWETSTDTDGNTVLTATLNCNTDALIRSFRFIPENGKMTFLVAVENDTQNCLVARGRVTVMNWIGDGDMQDPVTIESELAEIAELKRLVETKVIDSVEQSGGRIIFTFGDGSTWESDDLTGPPGPAGVSMSDIREAFADVPTTYSSQRAIGTALGRVVKTLQEFGLCLVAFLALAASATEWQDVPGDTVIGEGISLANGTISIKGDSLSTNDVQAIVADEGYIKPDQYEVVRVTEIQADAFAFGDTTIRLGEDYTDPDGEAVFYKEYLGGNRELAVKGDIPAVNIPPLVASATVGDLVDAINAVADALRKEEEEP